MTRNRRQGLATLGTALIVLIVTGGTTQARPHSNMGCNICHVPHNAVGDNTQVPLWTPEHTTTSLTGNYSSDTLDATIGGPDGASKLCLACHDGTFPFVSGDHTFGDEPSTEMGSLENTHPISFVYDQDLADTDGELVSPGTLERDVLDGNGKMQCSSCHDVHSTVEDDDKLLRWTVWDSGPGSTAGFCRHCHMK
jgi:hypothetical protein